MPVQNVAELMIAKTKQTFQDPILLPGDNPNDGSVYIINLNPPATGVPTFGKLLAASADAGINSELRFRTDGTTYKLSPMDSSGVVPTVWMLVIPSPFAAAIPERSAASCLS